MPPHDWLRSAFIYFFFCGIRWQRAQGKSLGKMVPGAREGLGLELLQELEEQQGDQGDETRDRG